MAKIFWAIIHSTYYKKYQQTLVDVNTLINTSISLDYLQRTKGVLKVTVTPTAMKNWRIKNMVNEVEKAEARAEQNVMQLEMIITGFLPILERQKKTILL